jgi:hypothetical protein
LEQSGTPHTITPGQALGDATALAQTLNLAGLLSGKFNGGAISSTPAGPNPALVNAPTCFFVNGLTADGQPVATTTNQIVTSFQITLMDPQAFDAFFRHVVYTFRIDVTYDGTDWKFGDTPASISNPKLDPNALCGGNAAGSQLSASYIYTKYSLKQPNGIFTVTAQHHYSVRVTAWWHDLGGPHSVDLTGTLNLPTLNVDATATNIQVVQEMGVPIP